MFREIFETPAVEMGRRRSFVTSKSLLRIGNNPFAFSMLRTWQYEILIFLYIFLTLNLLQVADTEN